MSENNTLKQTLGLKNATMIVAGSMIGSGIFILSSDMARSVGSAGYLLLLWIVTGIITVMAALCYGELAGMMPKAGGQFIYIEKSFGKATAFVYGWTVFTVIQTGVIAAVAMAFANYSSIFFPSLNNSLLEFQNFKITYGQCYAIGSIILLTLINTRGINSGKRIQDIFTWAKLIALFALIILGIGMGFQTDVLANNFENPWQASSIDKTGIIKPLAGFALLGAMGATIISSLFSSDAWNNVTFIAGEIKDPKRNIPRSLLLGTLIVTCLYILANIAYLSLLPLHGSPDGATAITQGIQFAANERVGAAAASMIFGNTALYIMAALIMVSTFGCNNGLILAGARVFYAMACEGLFIKKAKQLNNNSVPSNALWMQCTWAGILCLSGTYKDLVAYATFASVLFYIVTVAGLFVLRVKEPLTERPYKVIGYPILPALYIIVSVLICVILIIYDARNTQFALLCVGLGIPVYYGMNYWKKKKVRI